MTALLAAVAALMLEFGFFAHAVAQPVRGQPATRLTLGLVAEANQKQVEEHFREFSRYVAKRLTSRSTVEGQVTAAPSQAGLARLLTERKVDFYFESAHPTYMINTVYGAGKLLLRRWKGGVAEYQGLIFANKTGETTRLEDLPGKIIAFEDPESTSGYFLQKSLLTKKGFKLAQKKELDTSVPAGQVGYVFANSQNRLIDWVLTKRVAAGAFSNSDYSSLDEKKKSDLKVLAETVSVPRHLVSVRKDLAPTLVDQLRKILLAMHEDPEGRSVLQKTDETTKFDALPGGELAMRQRLLDAFLSGEKK
jgi:phosphonate transport system substrate-binding protein